MTSDVGGWEATRADFVWLGAYGNRRPGPPGAASATYQADLDAHIVLITIVLVNPDRHRQPGQAWRELHGGPVLLFVVEGVCCAHLGGAFRCRVACNAEQHHVSRKIISRSAPQTGPISKGFISFDAVRAASGERVQPFGELKLNKCLRSEQ